MVILSYHKSYKRSFPPSPKVPVCSLKADPRAQSLASRSHSLTAGVAGGHQDTKRQEMVNAVERPRCGRRQLQPGGGRAELTVMLWLRTPYD